jgi:hypothetical protein
MLHNSKPQSLDYTYVSQDIKLLNIRRRLNGGIGFYTDSIYADLLKKRYTESKLAKIVSMQDFMATDCFLFLPSVSLGSSVTNIQWFPRSNFYINEPPFFFVKAIKIKYANELLDPLMVSDLTQLRDLFKKSEELLNTILRTSISFSRHYPFGDNFDSNEIGIKN